MVQSLLPAFLGFLSLCLFLRHYPWIFLSFLQHLLELFHHFFIHTLYFIFFDLFVDILHLFYLPTCHQSVDFLGEVGYSYIFGDHHCDVSEVRVMTVYLGVFCDVFLKVGFADCGFLLGNYVYQKSLFLFFGFVLFHILSAPFNVRTVLLFHLFSNFAEENRNSLFLLLLFDFHSLTTLDIANQF